MWHAPNQRVRALANAKRRERERARRPIHIKRIIATIEIATTPEPAESGQPKLHVRLVLNDLSPKGAGLFSPEPLIPGQSVFLKITDPEHLTIKAKVVWCQEYHANSHVLSNQSYSYRIGIEFVLSPSEEQAVKIFCDEVAKNFLFSVKAV
jgi:hypothetical protein